MTHFKVAEEIEVDRIHCRLETEKTRGTERLQGCFTPVVIPQLDGIMTIPRILHGIQHHHFMVSHKTVHRYLQPHNSINHLFGMGTPIDIIAYENNLIRLKSQYIFEQTIQ